MAYFRAITRRGASFSSYFHGHGILQMQPWERFGVRAFAAWGNVGNVGNDREIRQHDDHQESEFAQDKFREWKPNELDVDSGTLQTGLESVPETGSIFWEVVQMPMNVVITMLDGIHTATGAPWWIVLAGSTVAVKLAMFPLTILQITKIAKIGERGRNLPPPIPLPGSGKSYIEQYQFFTKRRHELGVPSPVWFIASPLVQFPVFITWILSVRSMAKNHHPGFDSGGTLWFVDLTAPIQQGFPGAVFPVMVAASYLAIVEISMRGLKMKPGLAEELFKFYKAWLRFMTIPLLVSGFYVPQGVFMYWIPNNMLTLAQSLCLRTTRVRRFLGLPIPVQDNMVVSTDTSFDESSINHLKFKELLTLAAEHITAGRRQIAVKILEKAVEKYPKQPTAYYALGKVHIEDQRFEKAVDYFNSAAIMAKNDNSLRIAAYLGSGISKYNQGNSEEAITTLKVVASIDVPDDSDTQVKYVMALVSLASILSQKGDDSAALPYLRMAAKYDANIGRVYVTHLEKKLGIKKSESQQ